MLSSAKRSVPTEKQFIQPYFIEIAPDGAIIAACARFTAFLEKNNITLPSSGNIKDIFAQLGNSSPASAFPFPPKAGPPLIDLAISLPGKKPFIIRWTPIPLPSPGDDPGGWQLTGIRIYGNDPGEMLLSPEPDTALSLQAALFNYISEVVVVTDLRYQVTHWNTAAERFYGVVAEQALGRDLREVVRLEYVRTNPDEVHRIIREKGIWEGEIAFISITGKKSYLFSSIRYFRDSDRKVTAIVFSQRDITEIRQALNARKRAENQLHHYSEQITNILGSITDGFFVLDRNFRITLWNPEAERITRLPAGEMTGHLIWEKLPELVDTDMYESLHKAFKRKMSVTFEQYNERFGRWLEMSAYPSERGLFACFRDVSVRKEQEMLLALEKDVLELSSGKKASLKTTLDFFLKGIAKVFPGMTCSVLYLDDDGQHVRHLSAPGLPAVYSHAIDGLAIGPKAGSCGTAIYRREKVIVSNIETDPLWEGYRDIALPFGLRACWSFPIISAKGDTLAAFAAYYKTPKSPTDRELDVISRATNLVTLLIESKRAEEELNISNERYRLATKATNDAIWDLDVRTEQYFWGEGFYYLFGYKPARRVRTRKFWEFHLHPEDRERVITKMDQFLRQTDIDIWKDEYRFKKADGKYALISDRGFLIFGKENKAIRMVGSMQDITEKRDLEKKLLNQELTRQKMIAQVVVDVQEKERAEIGKELHDNINQILSTTKLYLELAKTDNNERLNLITRSAENIHDAIHEIRNISRSLVPASISDLGLVDSIADLVESIKTTRAINVEFYPAGKFDEKISDKGKLMLFRIIQEQVNNVLKHSAARNLIIEMILDDTKNMIELNITDDGKGFNPDQIKNRKGLGLSNIMSRVDLFGGDAIILSAPGQGCKLRVQVPMLNL